MTELGLTEQLVGHRDPVAGSLILTGWTPGPAGAAFVQLAGGAVQLWFDYADPRRVTEIQVGYDADRGVVARALDLLFPPAWEQVARRIQRRPSIVWRAEDTGAVAFQVPELITSLGRVAQLLAEVDEERLAPTPRAIAVLELSQLVADLPAELRVDPSPSDVLGQAAAALVDVGPDALARGIEAAGAHHLSSMLRVAAARLSDGTSAASFESVADRLDDPPREVESLSSTADMAFAVPPSPIIRPAAVRARGLTASRVPDRIEIPVVLDAALTGHLLRSVIEGDHLSVTVRTADDGPWWLRVFRSGTPSVLLAAVPMQANRFGSSVGRALLPSGSTADAISADVRLDVASPWHSEPTATLQRAVRSGRDACRAERQDDGANAERHWDASARHWDVVGDRRRSRLARRFATGSGRGLREREAREPQPPFLHER